MYPVIDDELAQEAAMHLKQADPILVPIVDRTGLCTIRPHNNYYWELVDAIISQQLSVKAAASIEKRFQELCGSTVPAPAVILEKSIDVLRGVGLSRPKANYIRDLAQHIIDGKLVFDNLAVMSNDEITNMLVDVKGIGEWTAHMFLMFCLGRLNVLPVGDLGIRNGMRQLYSFEHLPTPQDIKDIAEKNHWHPYESVASWYIWQNLDNTPAL